MVKEKDDFPRWLEEKKGTLKSARAQQALQTLLEENEDFVKEDWYRGTLRQDEFHRRLNEQNESKKSLDAQLQALKREQAQFQAQKTQWQGWYKENAPKAKAAMERAQVLEAKIKALEAKKSDIDDDDDLSAGRKNAMSEQYETMINQLKDQVNQLGQRLEAVDTNIPGFISEHAAALELARKEGFEVDPLELSNMALNNNITPRQAYYHMTQAQRAEKQKADYEKDIKEAEERGRRAAINDRPSPDHIRPSGPTVVDRLRGKTEPYATDRKSIVDGAVEEFRRIQAEHPEALL
jgi:chromosome segregation ATPase